MKFKVGDKVRVKKDLKIDEHYNTYRYTHDMHYGYCARILTIDEIDSFLGDHYHMKEDRHMYAWGEDMLELVEPKQFTKSDLKDGMVVEYRHGERAVYLNSKFISEHGHMLLTSYNDDLTRCYEVFISRMNDGRPTYDIVKVYKTTAMSLKYLFKTECLELVWERKEEEHALKYKVGDKVKVRSNLISYPVSGRIGVADPMLEYAGRTLTIASLEETYTGGTPHYHVKENSWNWSDDMFEGSVDYEEMTVAEIEKKLGYKVKIVDGE